jgi:hypothetical protein
MDKSRAAPRYGAWRDGSCKWRRPPLDVCPGGRNPCLAALRRQHYPRSLEPILESLNGPQIASSGVVGIALLAIIFPLVGVVVAARRPRNPLGWIFCLIGLFYGLTVTGEAYAIYALRTAPGSLPGGG